MTLSLPQSLAKTVKFSSNMSLLSKKSRLVSFYLKNIHLKLLTSSIESLLQNTDAETFTISAFSTFLIIIYDNTRTRLCKTVMTEHH